MTANDIDDFRNALFAMATAYQKECDELLFEAYWLTLNDLDIARVKRAIETAMKGNKHMPRAADLRELVGMEVRAEESRRAAEQNKQVQHDSLVWHVLREAEHYGKSRDYVEAELKRIGADLKEQFTVNAWVLAHLGPESKLAPQWPELAAAIESKRKQLSERSPA